MLGWFKKKFSKKKQDGSEHSASEESVDIDEQQVVGKEPDAVHPENDVQEEAGHVEEEPVDDVTAFEVGTAEVIDSDALASEEITGEVTDAVDIEGEEVVDRITESAKPTEVREDTLPEEDVQVSEPVQGADDFFAKEYASREILEPAAGGGSLATSITEQDGFEEEIHTPQEAVEYEHPLPDEDVTGLKDEPPVVEEVAVESEAQEVEDNEYVQPEPEPVPAPESESEVASPSDSLGQEQHQIAEDAPAEADDEITHIDVEELDWIDEDDQSPVQNESTAVDDEITVVAVEDLEVVDDDLQDAPDESTGKGELSEELLREIFPAPPPEQEKPQRFSMFQRLQDRLGKTRDSFVHRLDALFLGKKVIDQELLDELEEILITADLGVATTMELLDTARSKVKRDELSDPQALKSVLRDKILDFLQESDQPAELVMPESGPFVIMVVGVNGVGKTTTIGKIASKFVDSEQSVLLVAGDTFRAAAIDQLKIWGDRVGVDVVSGQPGCDPSSVVYDGIVQGVADDIDVIIIDTAGRLHTSVNLMEELKKIRRVIGKKLDGAPHEVMLVLDATTGQNAVSQAKIFQEAVGVSGLAMTKLDGTAKGGIVANVCRELKIPVRFIGIGEQVDDLRDFDPEEFVQALFSQSDEDNS